MTKLKNDTAVCNICNKHRKIGDHRACSAERQRLSRLNTKPVAQFDTKAKHETDPS